MFAIIKNSVIALLVPAGTAFTWNKTQYPSNWCNLSSPEEKANIGMVDVMYTARPDDRYYWVTQAAPIYEDGIVLVGYTVTPKDLVSLKAQAIDKINDDIYLTLKTTDYIMVRNLADPAYKPEWITWRDSVVSVGKAAKDAVSACADVESLIGVVVTFPNNPDWKANA